VYWCVYRSLDNRSNQIRWSLDLRWQRPDLPNGFYGLKDCITMAKSDDPNFKVSPATSVCRSGHPVIGGNIDSPLGCMWLGSPEVVSEGPVKVHMIEGLMSRQSPKSCLLPDYAWQNGPALQH